MHSRLPLYRLSILLITLYVAAGLPVRAEQRANPVPGMRLTAATRMNGGVYKLSDPGRGAIQVSGSGFEIDCGGARLVGPGKGEGVGIHITDARNVTLRNADVTGWRWGIVAERCTGLRLINCRTSYNNDLKPGTVIDESGREPEDQWGGGVLLRDCRNGTAQRCLSQYQWDGIDLVRCDGCVISDGDYSYNGNWGIHLWDSSHNTFARNRAVWCTTGAGRLYQALTGWQTYDAQAVGIDHNSCDNVIEGNDLRFGGDAIFVRANEGPITPGTVVPPRNGSHRNVLRNNDCSFSPNNAIEVDLVDDTIIENNNCSNSHYGMWLGYSRRCLVRGNICVNDTAHAVEIENGQDDVFERNVFGWDTPRRNGELVYLRQNGRDHTPSTGYQFRDNDFYGAGAGILLRDTDVTLQDNSIELPDLQMDRSAAHLVKEQTPSRVTEHGTGVREPIGQPPASPGDKGGPLRPGALAVITVGGVPDGLPPVVELDGIPAWTPSTARRTQQREISVWMPRDFWDRPATTAPVRVRVRSGHKWISGAERKVVWPVSQPRIDAISPDPAKVSDTITVSGENLAGGRLLLNGKPVRQVQSSAGKIAFTLPVGVLVPTRFNLLWEKGAGEATVHTWPITMGVDIPAQEMPHLISADFEPKRLKVGDLLKVTMTVRNNLPTAAPLTRTPPPPFNYTEKQAAYEMGVTEQEGKLHLRVTSDNTAPHDPGSWPYLFGFDRDALAPGETITVTGYIKMEHPGSREFRVGLVAGGFRFIDDNAFRTRIIVTE